MNLNAKLVGYLPSDNVHRLSTSAEFGPKVVLDVFLDGFWPSDWPADKGKSEEDHNGIIFDLEHYI